VQKLKNHLLSRLLGLDYDGDERSFSPEDRNGLRLTNHQIVKSKIFQVNYTTYDIHRDQDVIRPGSNSSVVMTLSREINPAVHRFWYAQVVCAFHIQVHFCLGGISQPKRGMEVLWVRWFGVDPDHRWGFKQARLPKISFVPDSNDAFGFLDPSLVIRGCHIIPAFADGRTDLLMPRGPSLSRRPGEVDDWRAFYVNM